MIPEEKTGIDGLDMGGFPRSSEYSNDLLEYYFPLTKERAGRFDFGSKDTLLLNNRCNTDTQKSRLCLTTVAAYLDEVL